MGITTHGVVTQQAFTVKHHQDLFYCFLPHYDVEHDGKSEVWVGCFFAAVRPAGSTCGGDTSASGPAISAAKMFVACCITASIQQSGTSNGVRSRQRSMKHSLEAVLAKLATRMC